MLKKNTISLYPYAKKVHFNSVDLKDNSFLISYGYDLTLLSESIKKVGVLSPPLLRKKSGSTYQIICGYKRIRALKKLGITSAFCTILPPTTTDKESFLLSLYDNISHRAFNPIEKSMVINKLTRYYPDETIVKEFLPLLNLHPHRSQLKAFTPLCRVEKTIKDAVLEGTISESTVTQLAQLDRVSRNALGSLLIALRLTVSTQAELLDYVTEIAIRDTLPVEKVIGAKEIRALLKNPQLNQPQKADAIRHYLRARRYPSLTAKEREFSLSLKKLKLHSHLHLSPPPSFEGNHYHLSLHFKDVEELKKRVDELHSLLHNHSFITLIEG